MSAQLALSIAAGASCGLILNVFYLCLKHAWPENYFGLSGTVDPIVTRNLARWAVFRLVPPAIGAAAASLTAERADGMPWLAAAVAAGVHVQGVGRVSWSAIRRHRWASAAGNGLIALLILLCMTAATVGREAFAPAVPEPEDLVSNLWAGFLAAIGAVYIQQMVLVRRKPEDLLSQSLDEIDAPLKTYAYKRAHELGIDPRLPLAIMTAENLQRPAWVRRAERLMPRRWNGTRCITQEPGARSDLHSIDLTIQRLVADGVATDTSPWAVPNAFLRHNPSETFTSLADRAHEALEGSPQLLALQREAQRDGGVTGPPDSVPS